MNEVVDMLRAAQGGHGLENVARLYGVSSQQALKVAEQMMPALAEGFRRACQSPEAMGNLMALMTSGPYGTLYNQPVATNRMKEAGSEALNAVFGSSEVSRAVATQVAASTGLNIALVKQMMPTYATLFIGGLAKSLAASGAMQQMLAAALSRMPGQTEARIAPISTGNPWMDAFAAFAAASMPQTAPTPAPAPSPAAAMPWMSGNPWADAFARMMFQRAPAASSARQPGDAWQEVVSAMTQTMAQTTGAEPASPPPAPVQLRAVPPPAPEPAAPAGTPNPLQPFQEFFGKMMTQGYPPSFPPVGASPFAVPEFWMRMMNPNRDDKNK